MNVVRTLRKVELLSPAEKQHRDVARHDGIFISNTIDLPIVRKNSVIIFKKKKKKNRANIYIRAG